MRRISARYAKPGEVLGRPVYDSQGYEVIEAGTRLNEKLLKTLSIYGVAELIIEDWRVVDVPVQTLISPELEGRAAQALRELMMETQGSGQVDDSLLEMVEEPIIQMTRELFPEIIGEPNAAGCHVIKEYPFLQPAKVAGLSLLLGRRMGYGMIDLVGVGLAALLKDVGYTLLPPGMIAIAEPTEQQMGEIRKHPMHSAEIVGGYGRFGSEVGEAIFHHHERWDGSGYPEGLKGNEIPIPARILGLADAYFELVSTKSDQQALMPHEAIEYVMAYSGELFDPDLVELFVRQVPLYPTGVTVKLNTGELGIVSDSKLGFIGRPMVRICFNENGRQLKEPYDMSLTDAEHRGKLIVQVLDY